MMKQNVFSKKITPATVYLKFYRISSFFNIHIALIFLHEECNAQNMHNHFVDIYPTIYNNHLDYYSQI